MMETKDFTRLRESCEDKFYNNVNNQMKFKEPPDEGYRRGKINGIII